MLYCDNKIIDISDEGCSYIDGLSWNDPFDSGSPAALLGVTDPKSYKALLLDVIYKSGNTSTPRTPYVVLRGKSTTVAFMIDIRNLKWKSFDCIKAQWVGFKRDMDRINDSTSPFVWCGVFYE